MKKYIIFICSLLLLGIVSMAGSEDLQTISYSVSHSSGHFSSDDTSDQPISFDNNYVFTEDQFFQCKIVSVSKGKGIQLIVKNTETGDTIINEQGKNLSYLNQFKLPKGAYNIKIISHEEKSVFDYSFSMQPFNSIELNKQKAFDS